MRCNCQLKPVIDQKNLWDFADLKCNLSWQIPTFAKQYLRKTLPIYILIKNTFLTTYIFTMLSWCVMTRCNVTNIVNGFYTFLILFPQRWINYFVHFQKNTLFKFVNNFECMLKANLFFFFELRILLATWYLSLLLLTKNSFIYSYIFLQILFLASMIRIYENTSI